MINFGKKFDVIIIGAGASGLMCGISAGKRGKRVLLLDHNKRPAKKILISGGGKCNFTNYNLSPENYICSNPHFVKSALARFTQWDFLEMISNHNIQVEEREQGQLFCKKGADEILNMLLAETKKAQVKIINNCHIDRTYKSGKFIVQTTGGEFQSESLVIATGGITWPAAGATDLGYRIGRKFGHGIVPVASGLVPLRFSKKQRINWSDLAGISLPVHIQCGDISFTDELLFTHTGISGPAVLQISNYWQEHDTLIIDFLPAKNSTDILTTAQTKLNLKNYLKGLLPERLIKNIIAESYLNKPVNQLNAQEIQAVAQQIHNYTIRPASKETLKRAEVTLGGIDTRELSSKTFESNLVSGLFFIGEVLDVTGWLGGYNLQWAWSSGYCAGLYV